MMKLNNIFRKKDTEGNGLLSRRIFRNILVQDLGLELSPSDLHHIMDSLDMNTDGRVSYHEFLDFVTSSTKKNTFNQNSKSSQIHDMQSKLKQACRCSSPSQFLKQFQRYDHDRAGVVTPREFQKVWQACTETNQLPISKSERQVLFTRFEANSDGLLRYKKLVSFLFTENEKGKYSEDESDARNGGRYSEEDSDARQRNSKKTTSLEKLARFLGRDMTASKLNRLFARVDKNGKGVLSSSELYRALNKLGEVPLSSADVRRLVKNLEVDYDGCVEYTDFTDMVLRKTSRSKESSSKHRTRNGRNGNISSDEEEEEDDDVWKTLRTALGASVTKSSLLTIFKKYDRHRSGFLSLKEMKQALASASRKKICPLNSSQLQNMFTRVDTNQDGDVDYEAFTTYLLKKNKTHRGDEDDVHDERKSRTEQQLIMAIYKHFKLNPSKSTIMQRKALRIVFQKVDEEHNGMLSTRELENTLKKYGSFSITSKETRRLFASIDAEADGQLEIPEFIDYIIQNASTLKNKSSKERRGDSSEDSSEYISSERTRTTPRNGDRNRPSSAHRALRNEDRQRSSSAYRTSRNGERQRPSSAPRTSRTTRNSYSSDDISMDSDASTPPKRGRRNMESPKTKVSNIVKTMCNKLDLPSKEILVKTFERIDTTRSGTVTASELKKAMQKYTRRELSSSDMEQIQDEWGHRGKIQYDKMLTSLYPSEKRANKNASNLETKFRRALLSKMGGKKTSAAYRKTFSAFKPNARGYIQKETFARQLQAVLRIEAGKRESSELFDDIDRKEDGQLDVDEWISFCQGDTTKIASPSSSKILRASSKSPKKFGKYH